jgi:hypothetical protein
MYDKREKYGDSWNMDVRILRARETDNRDFLGFIETPLDEVQLLSIWCQQVLEGAYAVTDDGFATLLMDLHRPTSRHEKAFLIGRVRPGAAGRWGQRRNVSLPNEHQAFE